MTRGRPRKRVGIYARLSLSTDESVSIDRQIKSAKAYAEGRGWEVVFTAIDDGVSATAYAPDRRPGWRSLLEHDLDIVLVWKIDRLARRVLDFLQAHKVLSERGTAVVAVEDPIDMTSPTGRAFATMLAVFAEMEAAAISDRVRASQTHRVHKGLSRGGVLIWTHEHTDTPQGKRTLPTPEGREGVRIALDILRSGGTLSQVGRAWRQMTERILHHGTVRDTLLNPMLAGGVTLNGAPLLDDDGVMVIDPERAILSVSDWLELCELVKARAVSRTRYDDTGPALLDGLLRCGNCGSLMGQVRNAYGKGTRRYLCRWRNRSPKGESRCASALVIDANTSEDFLTSFFLEAHGAEPSPARIVGTDDDAEDRTATLRASLAELEAALDVTDDEEEGITLLRRRKALREALKGAEQARATVLVQPEGTIAERWAVADAAERRRMLCDTFHAVLCAPAQGRRLPPSERLHVIYDEEDPLLRDFR